MNEKLPNGWEWRTIGEIAEVNPRTNKAAIPDGMEVSFVPMAAVSELSGEIGLSDVRPASELKPKSFRGFREGDVLVAKITPSMENGKAAVARGLRNAIGFGSTEFHVLRPTEAVLASYLFYFVIRDEFRADAARQMTGTAGQLRVPPGFLRSSRIPVPPIEEQERIVAAIEEHLSRLNAAEAAVASAVARVSTFERSILQRADDPQWPEADLGELLTDIEAGKSFQTPGRSAEPDEWGVIKVSAMTWGFFDQAQNKAVLDVDRIQGRYEIQPGDLLFSRANTSELVGASVLVEQTRPKLLLSDKSMRLLTKPDIDKQWLRYCLGAPSVRDQISKVATGTSNSMRNISQAKVRKLRVHVPPLAEQRRFADEIRSQRELRVSVEADLETARSHSAVLRRSILSAAFSGRLLNEEIAA